MNTDMKKQTAVEWLVDELKTELFYAREMTRIDNKRILDEITKEAKAMEKEQIFEAYIDVADDDTNRRLLTIAAEQYYNETYGGDK
jgi:hypothetical protein